MMCLPKHPVLLWMLSQWFTGCLRVWLQLARGAHACIIINTKLTQLCACEWPYSAAVPSSTKLKAKTHKLVQKHHRFCFWVTTLHVPTLHIHFVSNMPVLPYCNSYKVGKVAVLQARSFLQKVSHFFDLAAGIFDFNNDAWDTWLNA